MSGYGLLVDQEGLLPVKSFESLQRQGVLRLSSHIIEHERAGVHQDVLVVVREVRVVAHVVLLAVRVDVLVAHLLERLAQSLGWTRTPSFLPVLLHVVAESLGQVELPLGVRAEDSLAVGVLIDQGVERKQVSARWV